MATKIKTTIDALGLKFSELKDENSFNELYICLYPLMKNYGYKYFSNINYHDRKESLDNTFINIFEKVDQFNINRGTFSNWSLTIFTNECLCQTRKKKNMEIFDNIFGDKSNDADDIYDEEYKEYILRVVLEGLQKLEEPYRSVLKDKYLNEKSNKEIAEYYKVPIKTAKTHIHQGLINLRKIIKAPEIKFKRQSEQLRKVKSRIAHREQSFQKKCDKEQ